MPPGFSEEEKLLIRETVRPVVSEILEQGKPALRETIRESFTELIAEHEKNCPVKQQIAGFKLFVIGVAVGFTLLGAGGALGAVKLLKYLP